MSDVKTIMADIEKLKQLNRDIDDHERREEAIKKKRDERQQLVTKMKADLEKLDLWSQGNYGWEARLMKFVDEIVYQSRQNYRPPIPVEVPK